MRYSFHQRGTEDTEGSQSRDVYDIAGASINSIFCCSNHELLWPRCARGRDVIRVYGKMHPLCPCLRGEFFFSICEVACYISACSYQPSV